MGSLTEIQEIYNKNLLRILKEEINKQIESYGAKIIFEPIDMQEASQTSTVGKEE